MSRQSDRNKTMETKTKMFNDIEIQIFKIVAVGVIVAMVIA